jgi:HEAT repeat protein
VALVRASAKAHGNRENRRESRDLAGLTAQLEDAAPAVRRWAARDLAAHADAAPLLIARLEQESDPSVREAILISLTEIGGTVAVEGLVKCLRSDDAALRNESVEALKRLPNAVAPVMADLLADPDPDIRIFAVNVLESLRHPEVERWLIDVISRDGHINVCGTAVDLLGEVGTPAAIEPLANLKQRFPGEPYIAFAADLALRRIET